MDVGEQTSQNVSGQRDYYAHQRIPLGALRVISSTGIRINMLSCLQITSFITKG